MKIIIYNEPFVSCVLVHPAAGQPSETHKETDSSGPGLTSVSPKIHLGVWSAPN